MKKLLNLGRSLSKTEQKRIFGGNIPPLSCEGECVGNGPDDGCNTETQECKEVTCTQDPNQKEMKCVAKAGVG